MIVKFSHLCPYAVMFQDLTILEKHKIYCKTKVPLTAEELNLIYNHFEVKGLKNKNFLLHNRKICNFFGIVANGTIRHVHIQDGIEKTYVSPESLSRIRNRIF